MVSSDQGVRIGIEESTTVAVVGLGKMGSPQARALLAAGLGNLDISALAELLRAPAGAVIGVRDRDMGRRNRC